MVANKGRKRKKNKTKQLLCYFSISQAQNKMKKDFLVQLYIIFNCLIDLDYIRREESKIKVFFSLELQIHMVVHPFKGPLYMDTHGRLCVLGLPKGQVNPES